MSKPTALITDVTGQDGAYLAELLLKKGYIVLQYRVRDHIFRDRRDEEVSFFNQLTGKP